MKNYYIEPRWGGSVGNADHAFMRKCIEELAQPDQEHPDTWLDNEDGYLITLHEKGIVTFGNHERDVDDKHIKTQDRELMLRLWIMLAEGDIESLERVDWLPGRGVPPPTAEEIAEIESASLQWYRQWYDALGPDDPGRQCAEDDCGKYAIRNSVMCRRHHFHMIHNKTCPF